MCGYILVWFGFSDTAGADTRSLSITPAQISKIHISYSQYSAHPLYQQKDKNFNVESFKSAMSKMTIVLYQCDTR